METRYNQEEPRGPLREGEKNPMTLAKIALGRREEVPQYQIEGLVDRYLRHRSDPDNVAHRLATSIAIGEHSWDVISLVKEIAPDLPEEKLKELQVEMLVKAAGITATEELVDTHNGVIPIPSDKDIIDTYGNVLVNDHLLIDYSAENGLHKAKELVRKGLKYYKMLHKVSSKK